MNKIFFHAFLFLFIHTAAFGQHSVDSISETEVGRMLHYLASDSLKGRGNYTPELHKAARFITGEFTKAGLQPFFTSFVQPFGASNKNLKEKTNDTTGKYNARKVLLNVVGLLPGKTKPHEAVLFSAHYDHLGVNEPEDGDRIYNGANDNASGTAAVLALAHYFSKKEDNARTLIFCAFSGEELGLLGSQAFVKAINPGMIKAVINIEMIGQTDAVGKNSFFVTGAPLSDMASILRKNLAGTGVKIKQEPRPEKHLFQRSDNYPFAKKGIPAHSIMCSDDEDACYHKPCDAYGRIDVVNMTTIIRAIATASQGIIDGADTPLPITGLEGIRR
jgi:hypothetical protein